MAELWNIDELMRLAAAALETATYEGQPSGRVRETPDKRTIRYYTTLGLLDRPAEFRGRTAYYGRRHVLQLAAIKRLQAKGMTLVQIQAALAGADDRRLASWTKLPTEFWERHPPTPKSAPNPDRLLAAEVAPAPPARRAAEFWKQPPKIAADSLVANEVSPAQANPVPRPVSAWRLADGVTLLLEDVDPALLDAAALAELAPAAAHLVGELRRLKLIS